jgi:hypothetical protein
MKNVVPFGEFLNEKAETSHQTQKSFVAGKPKAGTYRAMVSKKVQDSIKKLCESMLHEEAMACDMNEDKEQTYEKYITECGSYMNEYMKEAMEVYRGGKNWTGR